MVGIPSESSYDNIQNAPKAAYNTKDEADEAQQALQNLRMVETHLQEVAVRESRA